MEVSRPYYQIKDSYTLQCVSFVMEDGKGKKHFFSVSSDDEMKLIMISEPGDEMLAELVYKEENGIFFAGYFLKEIHNLTLGKLEKHKKQVYNGTFVRMSRAFCLVSSFHYEEAKIAEVVVRSLFVLKTKEKLAIIETEKMDVIQFLQLSHLGDKMSVELTNLGEISFIKNKSKKMTYCNLKRV